MVLEIVGARYLMKDFGSSFYMWVSQIGVVLIALAIGYYAGGALADRYRRLRLLTFLLVPAGLVIAFIPLFAAPLINALIMRHPADYVPRVWQKLDPALGSSLVFLLPCIGLASVSPILIRLLTRNIEHVGRISGWIIAASTVGSIAGVFVSGYVLIDYMSVPNIFKITGALTVLLGLGCWALDRQWLKTATRATALLALAAPAASGALDTSPVTIFETTSAYHNIRVLDHDGIRMLKFDGAMQTRMSLRNPLQGHFEYTDYFHMPLLWNPGMTNVLMIGLGGASTQRSYAHYYTNITVESVEIDPVVLDVARQYFQLVESAMQKVHVADGRVFLRRTSAKYGAIVLDAYVHHRYGSAVPYHLATKEFFALVRDHLSTNGVLAYNVIGTTRNTQADLLGGLYKTIKAVFPQVYMFPAQTSQNVVLIATLSPQRVTLTDLQQRAIPLIRSKKAALPSFWGRINSFRDTTPFNIGRCNVLTDDYAPVDGLIQAE